MVARDDDDLDDEDTGEGWDESEDGSQLVRRFTEDEDAYAALLDLAPQECDLVLCRGSRPECATFHDETRRAEERGLPLPEHPDCPGCLTLKRTSETTVQEILSALRPS